MISSVFTCCTMCCRCGHICAYIRSMVNNWKSLENIKYRTSTGRSMLRILCNPSILSIVAHIVCMLTSYGHGRMDGGMPPMCATIDKIDRLHKILSIDRPVDARDLYVFGHFHMFPVLQMQARMWSHSVRICHHVETGEIRGLDRFDPFLDRFGPPGS